MVFCCLYVQQLLSRHLLKGKLGGDLEESFLSTSLCRFLCTRKCAVPLSESWEYCLRVWNGCLPDVSACSQCLSFSWQCLLTPGSVTRPASATRFPSVFLNKSGLRGLERIFQKEYLKHLMTVLLNRGCWAPSTPLLHVELLILVCLVVIYLKWNNCLNSYVIIWGFLKKSW